MKNPSFHALKGCGIVMSSNWISTRLGKKLDSFPLNIRPQDLLRVSLLDVVRRVCLLYNLLKSEFF